MTIETTTLNRRTLMGGALASAALLALPGCMSLPGFGLNDAIKRILTLSSDRAFARLLQDGGFWDQELERVGLATMLGGRGDLLGNVLTSNLFKDRLARAFSGVAVEGAERAAPLVADAVRGATIADAAAIVNGGPSAASDFLRAQMGRTLVEAMLPEVSDGLRLANEPLVGQALASLTGIDLAGAANNFATRIDNTIWREIGVEEAAIRADPASTNDPVIIGVFGLT